MLGLLVGCIWGLHAAVVQLPRQGYFLIPIVGASACAFIMWRLVSRVGRFSFDGKGCIPAALCCWFLAATMSTILNWRTDQVMLTYCVVFLAGALIFVALSGMTLTPRGLDLAAVGLGIGALFPLGIGLLVFAGEWGTDVSTMATAYRDVMRMSTYEAVTFGNRGNTAAFLLLVAPLLLALTLDRRTRFTLRAFFTVVLSAIVVNLFILQVRAAFLSVATILLIVWTFKQGLRRLPLLLAPLAAGWLLLVNVAPDALQMMTDQLVAAATVDTEGDASVQQRADAIREGVQIAERNWLLGIGPGAALTVHSNDSAHQLQVQQAMETGIFGLVGTTLFSLGVWIALLRTMVRRRDQEGDMRFALLVGPAAYLMYSVMANATLGFGSLNPWATLIASMLALMPRFSRQPAPAGRQGTRAAGRAPIRKVRLTMEFAS